MNSKQEQDHLTPLSDRVLEQQLALWVARHSLSSARINSIHQMVLRQVEPSVTPLPLEWWESFIRNLRSATQVSLHLSPISQMCRITTTFITVG